MEPNLSQFRERQLLLIGTTVEEFRGKKSKELTKGFVPRNIINLDEAAFFYKLFPNRNQAKVSGTKNAKDRMVVVFCASYTGEKLTPWVIGKSATHRSFKGLGLNKIGTKYM